MSMPNSRQMTIRETTSVEQNENEGTYDDIDFQPAFNYVQPRSIEDTYFGHGVAVQPSTGSSS